MHNYKELRVWRAACDLAVATYTATKGFPPSEQFGATGQLRRSAVSVAANIAEGAGRGSAREFRRYVMIAAGSAFEYETHVIIAQRVGLLRGEAGARLLNSVRSIKRMLYGLSRQLDIPNKA